MDKASVRDKRDMFRIEIKLKDLELLQKIMNVFVEQIRISGNTHYRKTEREVMQKFIQL